MASKYDNIEAKLKKVDELLLCRKEYTQEVLKKKEFELNELRRQHDELTKHYQQALNSTMSLNEEINVYKRLLEGEENKQRGLKQVVENIGQQNK
jgi:hypothetical protein